MKIVNAKNTAEFENVHQVSARSLHESEHVQVSSLTLQPGQALKRHITPVDAFFYVLEGTGMVEVGEEQVEVTVDMLVDSPKGIPHRLWNQSDRPFRFLVVKTPRQTQPPNLVK